MKLSEPQKKLLDADSSTHFIGGRQSGKTTALIERAIRGANSGKDVIFVTNDIYADMSFNTMIDRLDEKGHTYRDRGNKVFINSIGSITVSHTIGAVKGRPYYEYYLDEPRYIDEDIINYIIAYVDGSVNIFVTSTPPTNVTERLDVENTIAAPTTTNPGVDEEAVRVWSDDVELLEQPIETDHILKGYPESYDGELSLSCHVCDLDVSIPRTAYDREHRPLFELYMFSMAKETSCS